PLDRAVPLVATEDDPPPRGGQLGEALAQRLDPDVEPLDLLGQASGEALQDVLVEEHRLLATPPLAVGEHLEVGDVAGPAQEPAPAVELVPLPPEDQVDLLEDVVHVAPRADQGADIGEERPLTGRDLG